MLTLRYTNARGNPMGTSNRLCLHPDETVAKARALRADGASYKQIGDALGVPISTAWRWCNKTRKPPVAVRIGRATSNTPPLAMGSTVSCSVALSGAMPETTLVPTPDIEDLL